MFKTVIAATAAATVSAGISADFMQGFQTGVFLIDFERFEDYNCPVPELSDDVERYMSMFNMAKKMMGIKDGDKSNLRGSGDPATDMFGKVERYANQAGVIASVMDKNYDGGDFCQGLTVGFEGKQVGQQMVVHAIQNAFTGNKKSDRRQM